MSSVNLAAKEISLKVVYYGPGLGGKTSSLQYIHTAVPAGSRGELVSLATGIDRTLYFDYLPINLPRLRGYAVRVQLYTVPGQVHYNSTRMLVLTGADGVVFVADSQRAREAANSESLDNLRENLRDQSLRIEDVPLVLEYNKRDIPAPMSIAELQASLNPRHVPYFETVATTGEGIFEALKSIVSLVLKDLKRRGIWGDDLPARRHTPVPQFQREDQSIAVRLQELSHARPDDSGSAGDRPIVVPPMPPVPVPAALSNSSSLRMPSPGAAAAARAEAAAAPRVEPSAPPRVEPASPSRVEPTAAPTTETERSTRRTLLAELLPAGPQREAALAIESQIERGYPAQAIRLAARAFTDGADTTRDGDEAPLLHALTLGIPGDRYRRFRDVARRAEAGGGVSATDALFALFFVVDAGLRK